MGAPELVPPKFISLKRHPTFTEKWLQDKLIETPTLLGLGDLDVRSSERRQPSGGRLDLLLQDMEASTRYEVEIQLGSLDESHIIRTIEYWDIERRRYPQYEHVAVIVAEDITSRFLNVISLLNRAIPLMAIQLKGVEVNGSFTLVATRVLDLTTLGTEEEDDTGAASVDRSYWESRSSRDLMQLTDELFDLIKETEPAVHPNYRKRYIGLLSGGLGRSHVTFIPTKTFVWARFRFPRDEELDLRLDESGLSSSYAVRGFYRVQIPQSDDMQRNRPLLKELADRAFEANRD